MIIRIAVSGQLNTHTNAPTLTETNLFFWRKKMIMCLSHIRWIYHKLTCKLPASFRHFIRIHGGLYEAANNSDAIAKYVMFYIRLERHGQSGNLNQQQHMYKSEQFDHLPGPLTMNHLPPVEFLLHDRTHCIYPKIKVKENLSSQYHTFIYVIIKLVTIFRTLNLLHITNLFTKFRQ